MIINNKSIKGIFDYTLGVNFELNDLIISNGKLMHVHTDFLSSDENSDMLDYCEDYLQYVSYNPESNPNLDAPLTPNSFLNLFNRLYGGISFDGIKSISDIKDDSELISELIYQSVTSVYRINIIENNSDFLVPGDYLLKTFKTSTKLLQEITPIYSSFSEYTGAGLYLVQYDLNDKGIPVMSTRVISTLTPPKSGYIRQLISKLTAYRAQADKLLKTGRYFYQISVEPSKSVTIDLSEYNTNYFVVIVSGTNLRSYSVPVSLSYLTQQMVQLEIGMLSISLSNNEGNKDSYTINLYTNSDLPSNVDYFIKDVIVGKTII